MYVENGRFLVAEQHQIQRPESTMPPKGKAKVRAVKTSKSTKSDIIDPPKPFTRPSPKLDDFLTKLSTRHVYITHIDTKLRDFKRNIFLIPVGMNIVILAGIIWRIISIGPFYMNICFSLMGTVNETTVDTANLPMNDIIREIFRRAMIFMGDLLIYVFIWPWPREFFAGQTIGNPIAWRFGVGFRDKEIIIRRSRKWIHTVGNVLDEDGPGAQLLFSNVQRAIDPMWMNEKTGYLMLNKDWDLDWRSMVKATKLVDKKTLDIDLFRTTILVHHVDFGWMAIEQEGGASGSAQEEEGRKKIVAFKDELTALGKENLFFKWIELVQFESSQPGGFGPERQEKTMIKANEMFAAQGVDFDKFWAKIGGMRGMPGMDVM